MLGRRTEASIMIPADVRRQVVWVRYVAAGDVLWVPAWADPARFAGDPEARVECELNEFDDFKEWRRIWARARLEPVSSTGAVGERVQWRQGALLLRGLVPEFANIDHAAMNNRVLFRLTIEEISGVAVRLA